MATPVTDEERARIIELGRDGMSLGAIAREVGRSRDTIARVCAAAEPPVTFDRTRVAAATQAKQVDNRARRTALVDRQYRRAEAVMGRLERRVFKALVPTGMGEQQPQELDFVPGAEEKSLANAVTSYIGNAVKLEQLDGGPDVAGAQSMLGQLAAGFAAAYEAMGLGTQGTDPA